MKTKKAVVGTAKKNEQHNRAYPKTVPLSSLKEQIGQLLLLLLTGNEQPDAWQQFERLLRQVYEGGVL
jgi:hypothetical protein